MIRGLALTASFLLAGAFPALAQTHTRPHVPPHLHGPGHVRPDSAQHAAMHALLHGSWKGTLSHQGVSSGLDLSVGHDSLQQVMLKVHADQRIRAGASSDFVIDGGKLQWTQVVSDKPCKATAVVSAATPHVPETMNGTMACEKEEITFTLQKMTG